MKANRIFQVFLGLVLLMAFWWVVVTIFQIPAYLVPSPSSVGREFLNAPLDFLQHSARTLGEALAGFAIALVVGLIGGCTLFRFSALQQIVLPYTSALQAIPIVAIAPLLVVWFGSGLSAKILMAAIISFFPILTAVIGGFAEVDQDQRILFQVYRTSYIQSLRHLFLPSALPTIVLGVKISAGLATVGAIIAEMTGSDRGLGYLLLNATYRLETARLFVAIILSGFIGWVSYSLPGIIRYIFPKYWESARREDAS